MDFDKLNFPAILEHIEIDGRRLALVPLMKETLSKKVGHLSEFREEGSLKRIVETDEIVAPPSWGKRVNDFMIEKGGRLAYRYLSHGEDNSEDNNVYLWEDGFVDVNVSGNYITLSGASQNEQLGHDIHALFKDQWYQAEPSGQIYAIIRQGMHLGLSSIGNAGIKLVDGNYTPAVMEDYRFIIKDLRSSAPSGRLVLMRGSPGTGKTHLIRAMLLEVPDAMFVLISPDMVTNLAGPELLPLLMSHRHGTGPIILVLEDADQCLVSRDKDNIASVQSLLNLGDGILGSLLDLRIVATTNAHELHLDEAIGRPGRLSKMLEVGPLDISTARSVFTRLLPEAKLPDELTKKFKEESVTSAGYKMTLAEVYSVARKSGWTPEVRKVEEDEEEDFD